MLDFRFTKMEIRSHVRWIWLKVTKFGEPIVSMEKTHKQPFELLFVGTSGKDTFLPDGKIICSVPSAVQSHKPPVIKVLEDATKRSFNSCLELYGRYLMRDCTTIGNECLKFQSEVFFEKL